MSAPTQGRFWRFQGPNDYRVEVATRGAEDLGKHMEQATEMGDHFAKIVSEDGLHIYVDKTKYDRVIEIPYIAKIDRIRNHKEKK